ncbi:MAG TPA: MarR family transcriptional regulator [Chloroflexota bacterium]|nr:MarR family transcriptional regulator [Chloroflexota bacterium]
MNNMEHLYNLLKETFIVIDDGDRRLFHRFGLTPPRFYVLLHVSEEPGISSSDLSQKLLCDKSNVTRIVKGLEASGYLERRPHESDGRAQRLYLTSQGATLCHEVHTAHTTYNSNRLNSIDTAVQNTLIENLNRLHGRLREELAQQPPSPNGHHPS